MLMAGELDALFSPRAVALIGASANPKKLGNLILRNLGGGRFDLYPVNPGETEIMGLRCFPSVSEVPADVDLAVISLPSDASVEAVRECVDKGVRVVALTSSGFKESGTKGAGLEDAMVRTVSSSDTRLLGPNTMGVLVPASGLDTLSIPRNRLARPPAGGIGVLSQSGAVAVSFVEKANEAGLGIRAVVGLGNKADIDENDLLRYLGSDSDTTCIALYLESFSDGREFSELARGISFKKPVALVKSGRTESGSAAARSHTGSISSSSDALVECALRQSGVVRAYDEQDLVDVVKALATKDHLRGDRICVVASAGGFGVIATDYISSRERGAGMRMAMLSERTRSGLRRAVPAFSSVGNPVDLTLGVTDEMYDEVLGTLLEDKDIDGILMSLELHPPNVTEDLVDITIRRSRKDDTPIVVSVFGGDETPDVLRKLEKGGVPGYPTIWRSVRALQALAERGRFLEREKKRLGKNP